MPKKPHPEFKEKQTNLSASPSSLRRRLLGGGVAGATLPLLPVRWSHPVVESVLLPAHARTSPSPCSPVVTDLLLNVQFMNTSGGDINNLSATLDLAAVFGTPGVDWQLTSFSSDSFNLNASYDGDTDPELFEGGQTIVNNQSVSVSVGYSLLTLTCTCDGGPCPCPSPTNLSTGLEIVSGPTCGMEF